MQILPYPLARLYGPLPQLDETRVSYWDDAMEIPWVTRNPQPDCHKCGRGHIPTPEEMEKLQLEDVPITCECGSSFTLTEAFRNAIYRDRTDEASARLTADWVEVASLTPNVGSFEPIPFRSRFASVFRVDLQPQVPISDAQQFPRVPLPGPLVAVPYWIAPDGFLLLTIWSGDSPVPEGCLVHYKAYGYMEGTRPPSWVRSIHTARRLEQDREFDAAIAMLGVATEAFARGEFVRIGPRGRGGDDLAKRWRDYKDKKRGLSKILEEWGDGRIPPLVFTTWKDQVWEQRHLTFHEQRTAFDPEAFRSALDVTLALIFGIRPASMLELSGVRT